MFRTIITSNVYPPIPDRSFDWCAYYEGDEENADRYGWGPTEAKAIADLHANVDQDDLEERIEREAARIYEETFVTESAETASWAAAIEHGLTARIDSCRAQAKAEIEASAPVIPLRPEAKLRKPLNYDHTTALVGGILMQSMKAKQQ